MAGDLHALADAVDDEASFLRFLLALGRDWDEEHKLELEGPSQAYGPVALGWENGTIGAFLDAAAAWGGTTVDGSHSYNKPENPWQRAAHILLAGKFYE